MKANRLEARYIREKREELIQDQGISEEDLSGGLRLMIDRTISRLIVSRRIELYLQRNGILRRDSLKRRKILEPEPILIFWLQLQNSIDRALIVLGLDRKKAEEALDLGRYIAERDEEKVKAQAAGQGGDGQGAEKGSGADVEDGGQAPGEGSEAEAAGKGKAEEGGDE
jgi:hypothetical protein